MATHPDADPGIRHHHGQSGPVHHECHGGRRRLWLPPIAALRVRPYPWHDSRVVCRRGRGRDAPVVDSAWRAGARAVSAAYILYLAFRIATAPPLARQRDQAAAPAFAGGFLLAVANPKAYLAIGAVFAGISITGESGALDATVKIALLGVMIVIIHMCWLLAGASLSRVLHRSHRFAHRQCLACGGPGCHDRNRIAGLT